MEKEILRPDVRLTVAPPAGGRHGVGGAAGGARPRVPLTRFPIERGSSATVSG